MIQFYFIDIQPRQQFWHGPDQVKEDGNWHETRRARSRLCLASHVSIIKFEFLTKISCFLHLLSLKVQHLSLIASNFLVYLSVKTAV